jgi:hypothetical protein
MPKSLWIILAVLAVAVGAPYASADIVTLDLSGSLTPAGEACSPSGCTLGGDIVINNTTGTVTSVDFTVAGESPSVGPFNTFIEFVAIGSTLVTNDSAGDVFTLLLSGNPGTLVGYTGGAILAGAIDGSMGTVFSVNTGAALTEAEAVAAPEPSSVALMLLGVGLVFVTRKRIGQGLPQAS